MNRTASTAALCGLFATAGITGLVNAQARANASAISTVLPPAQQVTPAGSQPSAVDPAERTTKLQQTLSRKQQVIAPIAAATPDPIWLALNLPTLARSV